MTAPDDAADKTAAADASPDDAELNDIAEETHRTENETAPANADSTSGVSSSESGSLRRTGGKPLPTPQTKLSPIASSASIPGKIRSNASRTITSEPKRLHTEPNSRPM